MTALLAEPWAGLVALATLLLWPGLVIVRAPWPFVPFLSLSFWLVSWGFLSPAGPGRHRFVLVTLAFTALLSGLRLLKPLGASRPSWPTLVVAVAALGRLAPFFVWSVAPGLDAGFSSASTLLLVWRDGLPTSYLPLYPILGFGLGDSGLAALAADVSLLAGTPAHRAFLLATLASESLLVLALFAVSRRSWPQHGSGMGAVMAAVLGLLLVASGGAQGGAVLSVALATAGATLVLPAHDRSPRVAAGLLWAGAATLSAFVALMAIAAAGAAIAATRGWRDVGRLGLPATVAILLAAPWLWRVAAVPPPSVAAALPVVLLLVVVIGIPVAAARRLRLGQKPWLLAGGGAIVLAATLVDWRGRSALVRVTADGLAAARWLQSHSGATDRVCARDEAARAWIPALAGRATIPPRWPEAIRVLRLAPAFSTCDFLWSEDGSPLAPAAFRQGRVSVSPMPSPGSARGR